LRVVERGLSLYPGFLTSYKEKKEIFNHGLDFNVEIFYLSGDDDIGKVVARRSCEL